MRQFSMAVTSLWPPVGSLLVCDLDHCSGQNWLLIWFRLRISMLCHTLLIIFFKGFGGQTQMCRNLIVSAFGLKFELTKAFPLNSSEICFHWDQGVTCHFLRIMFLQYNLQAELWQNAVLCSGFQFLKFLLWSDWKYICLGGGKAVKSPWQTSKAGYSWPPQKVMQNLPGLYGQ